MKLLLIKPVKMVPDYSRWLDRDGQIGSMARVFGNTQLSVICQLLILIFGSLGHVHMLGVRELQLESLSKNKAGQLARFCSVYDIMGSFFLEKVLFYIPE